MESQKNTCGQNLGRSSVLTYIVATTVAMAVATSSYAEPDSSGRPASVTEFGQMVYQAISDVQRLAPLNVQPPTRGIVVNTPVQPGPPLREPDSVWIEATLASMTLDEKIGQMIMPAYSSFSAPDHIANYHVGGFIFLGNNNTAPAVLSATNYLQGITSVPLLFSTDCETGLGARFTDATRFPLNMGSGAAYDLDMMRQQGRITARECRAIGIQIGFGPVVDVNTEPINPIIGIRSFGDNPTSVAELAQAYVEGANAEGLLSTFKHFPGHGAAAGDSHLGLPTINISSSELQSKHVAPYADLFSHGIGDLVMSAHVWYPTLDPGPNPWPATLSDAAFTGILRNQLSYDGCVISDAFDMAGLQQAASTYDAVKHGVLAGLDIILIPPNVANAFNGIKDRVLLGEITEARIDESVRRILALKSRVGIPETVTVPVSGLETVSHPDNVAVAEEMGRKTIAGELNDSIIPVLPGESLGVFVLSGNSNIFYSYGSSNFTDAMIVAHPDTQVISVPASPDPAERSAYLSQAATFDKVLVVSLEWRPRLRFSAQAVLVEDLIDTDIPMAYVSFGSPYHWEAFPGLENFLCGFTCHYATQQQMALVITGQAEATANWPVKLVPVVAAVDAWSLYE